MFTYDDIFKKKKRVLFVTAHPDDVDVIFAGTLSRLNNDKKETFVLLTTSGGRGSRDNKISEDKLSKVREKEEAKALDYLDVKRSNFLSLEHLDGEVDNNMEIIGEIVYVIRKFKPEIVCTFEPSGYINKFRETDKYFVHHRDHRNTGICTVDAVYPFSRDRNFFTDQLKNGVSMHTVEEMLLSSDSDTNTKIDITDFIDHKKSALSSHKSQFNKEDVDMIIEGNRKGKKYFEEFKYIKLAW